MEVTMIESMVPQNIDSGVTKDDSGAPETPIDSAETLEEPLAATKDE